MPRRPRTAKKLAQRIELSYFKQPQPLRRWRFVLSIAFPAAALLWLVVSGFARTRAPYSMGPLSAPHALFAEKCSVCHVADTISFRHPVTDQACLACHDGPIHHADQKFMPSCSSCHAEHQGRLSLVAVRDASCTQCHSDLSTLTGAPHFVRTILSFARHPEFAPLRDNFTDPGGIKFNHRVHLAANLLEPDGRRVNLACDDCHRSGTPHGSWPYGAPGVESITFSGGAQYASQPVATPSSFHPTTSTQKRAELAYMAPPTYANTCFSCHALQFDARFADAVPHDKPEIVHAFLVKRFQEYAAAHPDAVREPVALSRLPGQSVAQNAHAVTRAGWITEQVAASEDLLWRKTCAECHTLNLSAGNSLPEIAPSRITTRWLSHAVFSHDAHRMVTCASCHAGITSSELTSDVNLPSVRVCQECHAARASAAPAGCFECHTYHDWSQEKVYPGKFSLPDLLKSSRDFVPNPPLASIIDR